MSKRRKQAYAGVIAVVAVAVVLDRSIGGGAAAPTVVQGASQIATQRLAATPVGRKGEGASAGQGLLPARFPANLPSERGPLRDIFGLTDVVRQALWNHSADGADEDDPQHPAGRVEPNDPVSAAEEFKGRHRVSAVVLSDTLAKAFVDGEWVAVGQLLDGCRLVRIRGQTAVFDCAGEEVELSVDKTATPDSRGR